MHNVLIRKSDQIMMSLVHYFVTKENYAPINVQGVKDEIWLENIDGPYRIIRINANPIINNEQYEFDLIKMQNVMRQVKKKTLSFNMNALNICLDLNNKINTDKFKNIKTLIAEDLSDIKKDKELNKSYPGIDTNLIEANDSLELIINVTNDINEKTEEENEKFNEVFSPKLIIISNIISLVCIILYIITCITSKSILEIDINTLAKYGANNILLVKSGEFWRIITSSFLHVGVIHLLVNLYSLRIIGPSVETLIGKSKFIFVYLISAISGSLMSLIFNAENIISVGASGAIFGLMGSLIYFGYHYRLYLNGVIKTRILPVVLMNLAIGFVATGIDNAAHIGGLIGGYLALMAVGVKNKSKKKDKINGSIVLILYLLFLSYIVFFQK